MTQDTKKQPRNRPASTRRSIWRGVVYGLLALILAIVALTNLGADSVSWIYLIAGISAFGLGRLSYRHFKPRYTADLSDEDLDHEAPVLFLRPFEEDAGWDGAAAFSVFNLRTWRKFPVSPTNLLALYLEMTGRASFEQVLAHVTGKIGPLVAIGEPGSPPILGARNVYVGDDNWQEEVIDLADRSRLVVLTAGTSEGVLWEARTMVGTVSPERLLLTVPGSSRRSRNRAYETFAAAASDFFPAGLPESTDGTRVLTFDAGWQPVLTPGFFDRPVKNSPPWVAKRLTKILV